MKRNIYCKVHCDVSGRLIFGARLPATLKGPADQNRRSLRSSFLSEENLVAGCVATDRSLLPCCQIILLFVVEFVQMHAFD